MATSSTSGWLTSGPGAGLPRLIAVALHQAEKWDYIDVSPANVSDRQLVTPMPDQVGRLVRTAEEDDPMMAATVALAFATRARRGELCALRWSDVTF